jgi:hypothetical protein
MAAHRKRKPGQTNQKGKRLIPRRKPKGNQRGRRRSTRASFLRWASALAALVLALATMFRELRVLLRLR